MPVGPGSLYLAGLICKCFFVDLFWRVGWPGHLLSQRMTASVHWSGWPEISCLGIVDWLAGPEAQQEIGRSLNSLKLGPTLL